MHKNQNLEKIKILNEVAKIKTILLEDNGVTMFAIRTTIEQSVSAANEKEITTEG